MCACFYAFVHSLVADRIVMAASRLLGATAAYVIILSFAAGHPKSYWNGCIKAAAAMICQQFFYILAVLLFLFKFLFKTVLRKRVFSVEASRSIWFWSRNF